MNSVRLRIMIMAVSSLLSCCTRQAAQSAQSTSPNEPALYTVYVMNRNIHTGLVVPVNDTSGKIITAMKYFENYRYIDFGWGEEKVYQTRNETWCMDVKAVTIPSSSVIRAEGVAEEPAGLAWWSGYTVEFRLTETAFRKLCAYIDSCFTRDRDGQLIKTSSRAESEIIFFRSVRTYCLFNTCNTWVADALKAAGIDLPPFMVITEGNLYDRIRGHGTVLKER